MRNVCFLLTLLLAVTAFAADLTLLSGTGRTVLRRGEAFDVAVRANLPAGTAQGTLEFWLQSGNTRTRFGTDTMTAPADAPAGKSTQWDGFYRLDTRQLATGNYKLVAVVQAGGKIFEANTPLEIVTNITTSDFRILNIGIPGWIQAAPNWQAMLKDYHFNFTLSGTGDYFERPSSAGLSGQDKAAEEMVRYGINYYKYPTVFGWGLAHRPIGMHHNGSNEVSWYDPAGIEISKQLVAYHTQACRRFPVFEGLNPMDEPDVWGADPYMAAAFEKKTGLQGPLPEEMPDPRWQMMEAYRQRDPKAAAAFEVFRNHVLQDFNAQMKPYMLKVAPQAQYTLQTMYDIHTRAGLYPSTNVFQDVQSTHVYVDGPANVNWMLFAVNFRRANRAAFWTMPLYVVTGCYGLPEDQWRSSWALGMSQKLDGHGYFLGAGELGESLPWVEYSLAEMVRLNQRNEQYGNFFLALQKPVEPLAVWFSMAQAAASETARHYEHEVVGAFYATRRAHFPSTVVTDEDVRAGKLREHSVLLLADMHLEALPADLQQAVADFQRQGGIVVADRLTTGVNNARRLATDFQGYAEAMNVQADWPTMMGMRRWTRSEEAILRDLGTIEHTLAPLIARPVRAERPSTLVTTQRYGRVTYVFVANDASVDLHPQEGERWVTLRESVPAHDVITLPVEKTTVVYDLFSGHRLPIIDGKVALEMNPAALHVLCLFPKDVPALQVSERVSRTTGDLSIAISAPGTGLAGVIPATVQVADATGRVCLLKHVAVDLAKKNTWSYSLAANDAPGQWQIAVTNLLTKKTVTRTVAVLAPPADKVMIRLAPVRIFDERAYPGFIKRTGVVVAPGDGCEKIAQTLAEALGAEVKKPADLRKEDVIPDVLQTVKGRWMMKRPMPLALTVGADVILVGTPENNVLLKDLNSSGMLLWQMSATTLGKGQGLVQYLWDPFDLDKDAVAICGYDEAGLQAAVQRFLEVAKAKKAMPAVEGLPLKSDLLAVTSTVTAAPPAPPKTPVITPAPAIVMARATVGDGVRKLAWVGGSGAASLLAVGSQDGRLTLFNGVGKQLWQRSFPYRVTGVSISPDGATIAAHAFPRTYLYDRAGTLQQLLANPVPSRDDVEGMVLLTDAQTEQLSALIPPAAEGKPSPRPRLLTGTFAGEVKCYDGAGKAVWSYFPKKTEKPANPDEKPLEPIGAARNVVLLPNGNIAVAGLAALVVLDAQGKEIARKKLGPVNSMVLAGDKLFAVSITKRKVYLLDYQLNALWEKTATHLPVAAAAGNNGATLAVALFNGEILLYDTDGNVQQPLRLPHAPILTAIAVDDFGRYAWVGTWEGELYKVQLQ